MKATLKRLSICPCGFPALADHIPLGQEYEINPNKKMNATMTCGGCSNKIPMVTIWVAPEGYLPEVLFQEPTEQVITE